MTMKATAATTEERAFLADRYRQYTFDLLLAATRLESTTAAILSTRVKVASSSIVDLDQAKAILGRLPAVRVKGPADRA